ncbi:MAG: tetratricopeptide repeat protein [Phycisphaerae bacterium]|nr:tetratricopeptide repeat protein [Phycisphaerae bacterium]
MPKPWLALALAVLLAAPAWGANSSTSAPADPVDGDADYLAAAASFANGHYGIAIGKLADVLKRYPRHARVQMLLATACERTGQLAAARDLYVATLAGKPDARIEALANERIARLARRPVVRVTTAPSAPAAQAELTPEQVAAMSVIYPEATRKKTDHFDITTNNPVLADLLAQSAEAALERVRRTVLGDALFPHRVELTVYANQAAFRKAQATADWAGGGFLYAPQSDGSVRRVVMLYQVDEENRFRTSLLARELPHELAHVALKEFFGQAACPLWLEEGLATAAEFDGGRSTSDRMAELLSRQAATPLAEMIDQANGEVDRPAAFYIQAASWTRFLRANLSDGQMKRFLAQLKEGQKPSVALGRSLVLDDRPGWLGSIEDRWHKWAAEKP